MLLVSHGRCGGLGKPSKSDGNVQGGATVCEALYTIIALILHREQCFHFRDEDSKSLRGGLTEGARLVDRRVVIFVRWYLVHESSLPCRVKELSPSG